MARKVAAISTVLGSCTPTVTPGPTPSSRSTWAMRFTGSSSSVPGELPERAVHQVGPIQRVDDASVSGSERNTLAKRASIKSSFQ